uniref:Uncharacterized protein n=1 Tax=Setaria italica TaxID=4555 RepID=K3YNE1_SETIT
MALPSRRRRRRGPPPRCSSTDCRSRPHSSTATASPPNPPAGAAVTSTPPLLHWERKAKDLKHGILCLCEELKLLQGTPCETEPPVVSCRCHFFDGCGDLPPPRPGVDGEHWVEFRILWRFSTAFLVELSDSILARVNLMLNLLVHREACSSFATFSHQAVDFILGKLQLFCYVETRSYIGHLIIISVSQKISSISEGLLLADPFD